MPDRSVRFSCGSCLSMVAFPADKAGSACPCPVCGETIRVHGPPEPAVPESTPISPLEPNAVTHRFKALRKFLFAAGLAVVVLCAVIWVLFRSPTSFGSVQHVRDRLESSGFYALGDPERQILSGRSLHCTTFAPDATKPAEGSLRVFHDDKSQVVALSYIVDESADDLATWARSAAVEKLTGFDAPVAVKELTRYPFFSNMDQPDSVCYGFSEGAWLIRGICEKEKPTWGLVVIMHKASW